MLFHDQNSRLLPGVAGARALLHKRVLFPLMYQAYVSTPVGPWVHRRDLHKARDRPPHTRCSDLIFDVGSFLVAPVAMLDDNYAYIMLDKATGECAAVDPADPDAVMNRCSTLMRQYKDGSFPADSALATMRAAPRLTKLLVTHKHHDHAVPAFTLCAGTRHVSHHFPFCDRAATWSSSSGCQDWRLSAGVAKALRVSRTKWTQVPSLTSARRA